MSIKKRWKNLSIAKKLYAVVGVMAVLLAAELFTLQFAMGRLSAVRAFVSGEALWSKAQKNAVISILRYGRTHDEADYREFLKSLEVPEGDRQARKALEKANPDFAGARIGFIRGKNHPDDVDQMIELLLRYSWISYLDRAVKIWIEADGHLEKFQAAGIAYHRELNAKIPDQAKISEHLHGITILNDRLTGLEEQFSFELGEGSRWLEHVVIFLLSIAVLTVEGIGLTFTFMTTRSLSRRLDALSQATQRMGQGDFSALPIADTNDEIGQLTDAVRRMGQMLEKSYRELEVRVQERTSELQTVSSLNARLYEEAKAAVQTRDDFISIASHELRTPLTALSLQQQLLVQVLEHSPDPSALEKAKRYARTSADQTVRLAKLLDELLDLSRLRSGTFQLNLEKCNLAQLTTDLVSHLSVEALRARSTISLATEPSVPATVDPTRIRQVLTNLITNAIKYGGGKPIEVVVSAEATRVRLEVKDSGLGIPADKKERIFDRFERAVSDRSIAGLGLGLYITRQIVEAHRGSISVESTLGVGSRFIVVLPREPEPIVG